MSRQTGSISRAPLRSLPALGAALRQMNANFVYFSTIPLPARHTIPPMYQVRAGIDDEECEAAVRLVGEVTERMRRLMTAYGEWREFDVPAYFDLPTDFSEQLVRVVERVSTVHIIFFTDLLIPSFQQAVQLWETHFLPAYQLRHQTADSYRYFFEEAQPAMDRAWHNAIHIIRQSRTQLIDDIGFFTTTGADDERMRWQTLWEQPPVAELEPRLAPPLATIPTLTLALDFPLPAQRQPERIRRLRQSRERQRRRRRKS